MLIWKIFGTLFIISVVVAAICAVCKLVVSLETLRDRTDTLVKFAVEDEKKISELDDDLSNLAKKVYSDSAEIAALDDIYEQLLKRIDDLEKKLEKGGAQIERKTGKTGKEG